jgi:hypothetical protein
MTSTGRFTEMTNRRIDVSHLCEEEDDEDDDDPYIRIECSGCNRPIGMYTSELEIFMFCDNCEGNGDDEDDDEE